MHKSEHFQKSIQPLGQPLYKGPRCHFQIICVFCLLVILNFEREMAVNVQYHRFEHSRHHDRPADYGPLVGHRFLTFVLSYSHTLRSFISMFLEIQISLHVRPVSSHVKVFFPHAKKQGALFLRVGSDHLLCEE